ncbi:YbaB/EbfC family nucleoid-associated protein [Micromonospora orduensis]|uniref:YbaB/EbfC family nucleoid-associated protein n=1 Tax=Micromonospora orduensis TaxID=1420891 RepID=A0A5C4R006_9ACTN|nr:YbaB/EbfC family nucleoid-associated protein [Micromonospora orduensis]TNH31706.1 YbaB/EbfC family nucleoid-associated protein [Micromonospora orduensis]
MRRVDIAQLVTEVTALLETATSETGQLAREEFVGTAADGMVTATVSGAKELLDVSVAARAPRTVDNITLGEAVVEAVRAAEALADERRAEIMSGLRLGGVDVDTFLADPMSLVPHGRDGR